MSSNSAISWTTHSFNLAWGCEKISPGCKNCYADTLSHRYGFDVWGKDKPRRVLSDSYWAQPLKWNEAALKAGVPALVFCSSMADIGEDHPTIDEQRERLWPLIRQTPWLTWQLLTKRSDRLRAILPTDWGNGYANVWLGVSVENQDYVHRVEHLRDVPAAVRFVSAEPLLGPVTLFDTSEGVLRGPGVIDWLICGGESGTGFRPMSIDWARSVRDQCVAASVPFFYKQGSGLRPGTDDRLDGVEWKQFPHAFRGTVP